MHHRFVPEKCAIKPSTVLTAHLHMSSVAHLQKSDKKKVDDFTSRINQCAVVSSNNSTSSLAEAKQLLIYGLTAAQQ